MLAGVGFGPIGMKENTNTKHRKMMETTLMGSPNFPSRNFEGRRGSPRIRLSVMQDIDTI